MTDSLSNESTSIETSTAERDLGIIITSDLKASSQSHKVTTRICKTMQP